MVRATSYEVYEKMVESRRISKKRGEVLLYVSSHPECTAWDCEEYYSPRNRSTVNARFSELRDMGLVEEVGYKVQNGNKRITWRTTGRLDPLPRIKGMDWKEKYAILLEVCLKVIASDRINDVDKQDVRNALVEIKYITTSSPDTLW